MSHFLLRDLTVLIEEAQTKVPKDIFLHVSVEFHKTILCGQMRYRELGVDMIWRRRTLLNLLLTHLNMLLHLLLLLLLLTWQGRWRVVHPVSTRTT